MKKLPIIPAVEIEKLEAELTYDKFIRDTNYGGNKIYVVSYQDSPNVVREIGRLRELAFREAGGGTGLELDLDEYDTCENSYKQLIVWEPNEKKIIGGYRYIECTGLPTDEHGNYPLATSHLFKFSDKFRREYMPHTIELGRSFVHPDYQSSKAGRKSIFTLDNLWDGLGALTVDNPQMKYFFGKVTMYTSFNKQARDMILFFMKKHFPDKEGLVCPFEPLALETDEATLNAIFPTMDYKENYKILSQKVRELNENIPPLVNSYMNLSPTFKTFGTAMNYEFGAVEETGILITIDDIYPTKSKRHLATYKKKQ